MGWKGELPRSGWLLIPPRRAREPLSADDNRQVLGFIERSFRSGADPGTDHGSSEELDLLEEVKRAFKLAEPEGYKEHGARGRLAGRCSAVLKMPRRWIRISIRLIAKVHKPIRRL